MIRDIATLTLNDLAIAYNNKTLLLIVFIPLFVFISLELVDGSGTVLDKLEIGLVQDAEYFPGMVRGIQAADEVFVTTWLADSEAGVAALKDRKIDGLLIHSGGSGLLELVVLTKTSHQTLAMVEGLSALQHALENRGDGWVSEIRSLHDSDVQKQTLPTWILMLVLLVGFVILPAQVAEEKEKNLLLGILQTPVREADWLLAKLLLGLVLIGLAVGLLHLLGGMAPVTAGDLNYLAFLLAGGLCFSAFGIFLGFLCRKQASARTLGVLLYLPNLLPAALSDFSSRLTSVAPVFPSFQFYGPVRGILLEDGRFQDYALDWIYLLTIGITLSLASWLIMKKRWMM